MLNNNEKNFIQVNGIMAQGYGFSPKAVMRDTRLTIEAKAIYAYMSSFAGSGLSAFPSVELQLHELGISKSRYYKHRKLLEELGYITIKQTRTKNENGKSVAGKNIYTLEQFPVEREKVQNKEENPSKHIKPEGTKNKETDKSIENTSFFELTQNEDSQSGTAQRVESNSNNLNSNNLNSNNLNSSSSTDDDENELKEIMKICQKCNYKIKKDSIKKLLLIYSANNIIKAIVTASMQENIKNFESYLVTVLNDLDKTKINNINVTAAKDNKSNSKDTFNNFEQRDYNFEQLEADLTGWYMKN